MAYKYSLKRSRRDKRRNTRRHRGGRGAYTTGATQSAMQSNPAPFAGGKRRGATIHSPLHSGLRRKKTRKQKAY